MKKSVIVFHPGLQHSHQLAWGLYEAGLLTKFISGVPVKTLSEANPFWLPDNLAKRIKVVGIPPEYRFNPKAWWPLSRICSKIKNPAFSHDWTHRIMHAFDRWSAAQVLKLRPKAVVAFENSALRTFEAAHEIGAKCILDAPSLHYATANKLIPVYTNGYLSEVNKRKDLEVDLADAVLTCSDLARDSYIAAGVSPAKVHSMILGATLPIDLKLTSKRNCKNMVFIFAGTVSYRKSMDLILSAFSKLREKFGNIELRVVGGVENIEWLNKMKNTPGVFYYGQKSQFDLYELFCESHCLILPSRFDSFGMVVAEAMAVGVPAIVSSMTGAKKIIETTPGSGWIVNPTEQGVYDGMEMAQANFEFWGQHELAAKKAAEYFTWPAYRARVSALIEGLI